MDGPFPFRLRKGKAPFADRTAELSMRTGRNPESLRFQVDPESGRDGADPNWERRAVHFSNNSPRLTLSGASLVNPVYR